MNPIAIKQLSAAQFAATQALVSGAGIPWASRPGSPAVGETLIVNDVGNCGNIEFRWSGTEWRPKATVQIYSLAGTKATPFSTISGNGAAQVLTWPVSMVLPAGMRWTGMRIRGSIAFQRSTLAGAPVTINYAGLEIADQAAVGGTVAVIAASTAPATTVMTKYVDTISRSAANSWLNSSYMSSYYPNTAAGNFSDITLSDAAQLFFRFRISAEAIAGDVISVFSASIILE